MPELDQADEAGLATGEVAKVQRWIEARAPLRLSINDQVALPVEDEESRRMLLDLVDRLEMLADVRTSMQELAEGKGMSLEQAKEQARRKYGISV